MALTSFRDFTDVGATTIAVVLLQPAIDMAPVLIADIILTFNL